MTVTLWIHEVIVVLNYISARSPVFYSKLQLFNTLVSPSLSLSLTHTHSSPCPPNGLWIFVSSVIDRPQAVPTALNHVDSLS